MKKPKFNIGDIVYYIPDAEKGIVSKHKICGLEMHRTVPFDPEGKYDIYYSSVMLENSRYQKQERAERYPQINGQLAEHYTHELEYACDIAEKFYKRELERIKAIRNNRIIEIPMPKLLEDGGTEETD
jgi:hypothetical protein